MKLRPYQEDAIQCIEQEFKDRNKQYIVLPTGSGKTTIFLTYAAKNHKKILIIVPSIQLLKQVYESALFLFHKSEISRKGGEYNDRPKNIHICVIYSAKEKYLSILDS